MNINLVVAQLRGLAPIFAGNVAGAAAYANGVADQVWLPRPAAYVIPAALDAGGNESMTGSYQVVTESVTVIVDYDNAEDRRGQAAAAQLDILFRAICKAILNWRPDWDPSNPDANYEARGFRVVSGELMLMDRARLHYGWTFALDITLTDADGWEPSGPPLTEIQLQTTDPTTGAPLPGRADIQLAQ